MQYFCAFLLLLRFASLISLVSPKVSSCLDEISLISMEVTHFIFELLESCSE